MAAAHHSRWNVHASTRGGGIIGHRHNLLNREWDEMCGAEYTLNVVTNEPKTHGVAASREANPLIGGQGGQRSKVRGYPYTEDN